ncbi:MAG: 2-succinylbenzoate--CoA ligase [Pegethrix bostrychoides GSE-TBD4-15B]|jgi:O-succinylbenzoic acid--CoA ligase|uniref:2-succinylbenzoate--CoA ligase n=1 Tax=Pegethrix bostrychoides GSE-TBD4-15B TaxID=2839662 RepID=A0A951U5N0_9CYAN|nr:2-succinylbenzoate--CoA ligase [Pegethrix bostrychoides GSE-TBD4-15B]
MTPFTYLKNCRADWLIGQASHAELLALTQQRLTELARFQSLPVICLAETEPTAFLAGWIAACELGCPLFLGNPSWAVSEWRQVCELACPDLVWGKSLELPSSRNSSAAQPGWIMIPTGGSSGQIRFAVHTWETLMAAVSGFQAYFQIEKINTCCVLPLYHVSGLMQALRSFSTGGKLALLSMSQLEQFEPEFEPEEYFLSLVPTQLQRLLPIAKRLARFRAVFLGGAAAWPKLLAQARQAQIPLAPTYGMTETAAQIATLKPADFLQGKTGCGQLLPHADIQLVQPDTAGIGSLTIRSNSLMLGYFPALERLDEFQTDDLGYFDVQNSLHIKGRSSQKIITGGENVFPTEVEAAIRATGLVSDVAVLGMPDQTWGETVVAVCVAENLAPARLKTALEPYLSSYKLPKRWLWIDQIPRNAQGKVNLTQLKQFASGQTHIPPQPPTPSADA